MASRTPSLIDLNTADEQELERIEGIDSKWARRLVEHRRAQGPFRSWDELQQVLGLGAALLAKVQQGATLGAAESNEEVDVLQEVDALEEEEGPEELEVLGAIARLDLEAALAYDAAAQASELPEHRSQLTRFRDDHFRHVDDLDTLIRERGGTPVGRGEGSELLLRRLALIAAPLGPVASVLALLGNEQLTNGTYDTVLEYDWDQDVLAVLARNLQDEQRHLTWLSEQQDLLEEEIEQPDLPA